MAAAAALDGLDIFSLLDDRAREKLAERAGIMTYRLASLSFYIPCNLLFLSRSEGEKKKKMPTYVKSFLERSLRIEG